MDRVQVVQRALQTYEDDLDSTIKRLNDLCLESSETILSADVCESENVLLTTLKISAKGVASNGHLDVITENPPVAENRQTSHPSSKWVEVFVRDMMSTSNTNDLKACASSALEAFEKSVMERVGAEAVQNLQKENVMLKKLLAMTSRGNTVLKRGVAILYERQKEFDERAQEVNSLKQLVLQQQRQLRTLEMNNYALRVHLEQAQHHNSMPGCFRPNVF